MEENIVVTEEQTQPEVETEETTPAASEESAEPVESASPTTAAETAEGSATEDVAPPTDEPLLTVKHNKRYRQLSHDDAVRYAQMGIKYEGMSPVLETLKYVAASEGKTLAEFVEAIRNQHEESLFSRLMDRCGDEEIARELLEVEKGKHKSAYEELLKREQAEETETDEALTKRMADEFDELRKDFPQYTSFEKLPKAIVREAVQCGITLLDAQLRYEHRQRVKAETAAAAQAAAAKASLGSHQSGGTEQTSSAEAAFLKGLWG